MENIHSQQDESQDVAPVPAELRLLLGEDIPDDDMRKFFWAFNFEMSRSYLPKEIISYIETAFYELFQFYLLHTKFKKIKDEKQIDIFFEKIQEINMEAATIIRAFRGFEGFTVRMERTSYDQKNITGDIYRVPEKKRFQLLKRRIGTGTEQAGAERF